jgi:hypothetical protein
MKWYGKDVGVSTYASMAVELDWFGRHGGNLLLFSRYSVGQDGNVIMFLDTNDGRRRTARHCSYINFNVMML